MELDGIRVQHAGLEQAAQDLLAKVKDIDSRMNQLERELGALRSSWAGNARLAYDSAKATWDGAIEEMRLLLQDTGRAVDQSNADYAAADARGAQAFQI
ncbi:WXG100 family type VII secretion target [Nocardioides pantholopis]|uniref:WXG100 family type VII secretion target n=1 Tax=Nocardioides pantholopis TaxID=2483798 RepID=UPI000F08DA52|nr:WXG100 family type VII secretion target [Nocardioides pantholopis]